MLPTSFWLEYVLELRLIFFILMKMGWRKLRTSCVIGATSQLFTSWLTVIAADYA
jgi:hypothetical protein